MKDGLTILLPQGGVVRFLRLDPPPAWRLAQLIRQHGNPRCIRVEILFGLLWPAERHEVEKARLGFRQIIVDERTLDPGHGLQRNAQASDYYRWWVDHTGLDRADRDIFGVAVILSGKASWKVGGKEDGDPTGRADSDGGPATGS
jgi:hypothetical protein